MADAAPPHQPPPLANHRFTWPGGLSARLLLFTALIVALANLLILPPNLAASEKQSLLDRLRAAELASLVEETAPNRVVSERLSQQLLNATGVVSVAIQADGMRRLVLQAPPLPRPPARSIGVTWAR